MKYIFFGRLEYEKWADLILELPKKFPNIQIKVFGKWNLENKFKQIFNNQNFQYLWRAEQKTIYNELKKTDISLMPSRFLETFWLSALESISMWVPVIGFNKWWLTQFVHPQLAIKKEEDLFEIINKLENNKINLEEIKNYSLNIAKNFTKDKFIYNLKQILPPNTKKIILISDYLIKIWWIENYIWELKNILENNLWIKTIMFGYNWNLNKIKKIYLLAKSYKNIKAKNYLNNLINQEKPDLLRYHSISRNLWPEILDINFKWEKRMTYHDFGYFAPMANKVFDEKDLVLPWKKKIYFEKINKLTNNPILKLYLKTKFYKIDKIRNLLIQNIDKHIIPSQFMKKILYTRWIPNNIYTLPHFINL